MVDIQLGEVELVCVHGSPRSFDDQILSTTDTERLEAFFGGLDFDVLACGHTHVQVLRRIEGKSIVGVGSVGMPFVSAFDGSGPPQLLKHAEYAIVGHDDGQLTVDLRQIPYNFESFRQSVADSKMPYQEWWCEQWIRQKN